ncbi:carboxylesterase/lipase family protein [Niveispirillum fermenti]|uniref:carboxylesterase/lipase family protein n=1 Tax=Niveispirillum fermenti TaxID=1233113 RepID=UPI003A875B4A
MEMSVVTTGQGRVRGHAVHPEVRGFFGIPYAAAPVGRLRWRPPEPPAAWAGIREADRFGPDPIQPAGLRVSRAPARSEDCLYLNIWAPRQWRAGGWPVMVWSCGGAFTTGGGAFVEEDPARLAAKGAVVVSFNIRLNILGFFAHAALSAESPHGASGNYGLMDQAAALRWVRENIAAFNGDSGRITFFGESAGATCGLLLLASPLVKRPYDRAILMSPGSFSTLLQLEEAERHGAALGATVEAMRAIPAEQLLAKITSLPPVRPSLWLARPLRPIMDGWFLTTQEPLSAGNFDAVPAIIGTNEDEGRFFAPRMGVRTVEDYKGFVRSIFGPATGAALAHYPVSGDGDVPAMFAAIFADRGFNLPIDGLARAFARGGADLYRYVYTYRQGDRNQPPTHAEEIGVLMDTLPHVRPGDAVMADMMARYWLSFAEKGNPNGSGQATWPGYTEGDGLYLRLDLPVTTGKDWRAPHLDFMAAHSSD